ncbi:MAG: TonB-dependent receptor [Bacteroidales bacterium]|nr:TonB-dependent receptor [Bacteroidales bacterium]
MSRVIAVMCALVLSMGAMWAQNLTVTGKVIDQRGEPVVGAYVVVKGTSNGASTDIDGVYKISAPSKAILEFSSMGYKSLEAAVNGRAKIDVILEDDALLLENAVVVGFGVQKKENLTGAVAAIDAEKVLDSRPIADIGRGLQGTAPGLNIRIGSAEVGSDPIFRIRGQVGSANGSASPLILLDNVEIPSINVINPDDIESVSVLKDAASASIYGAKAAFGVILIQSKKGSKQKNNVKVTYSGNVSFQNVVTTKGIAGVDALHYTVEAAERGGTYTPVGAFWLIDRAGWEAAVAWDKKYGKNGTNPLSPDAPMVYGRDWYVDGSNRKIGVRTYDPFDYLVRRNAPTHSHNISIAGNKDNTNFNISLGYLDQSGMMKATKYDGYTRYNANARINTKINDWVSVHAGLMYTNSEKRWAFATNSTTADVWYYVYRWGPTYPLVTKDEYGNNVRTAAYELSTANKATLRTSYVSVNTGITVTPLEHWNINVDYTYSNNNTQEVNPGITYWAGNTWSAAVPYTDASGNVPQVENEWAKINGLGGTLPARVLPVESYTSTYDSYYQDSYTSQRQTWNVTTTYDLNIKDEHMLNFMLGLNAVDYRYTGVWAKKMTLLDIKNPQFDLATGTQTNGGSNSWNSTVGFFGRVNYNYKERYLIEGNLRYDGSSKFPTKLKWRWFPSVSAGWRLSEEPWMEGAKDVLSNMKIRASWGSIGDQSVPSSLYIPTMGSTTTYWQHNGIKDMAYATPGIVATDITWQDINTLDFGVDFSLFNQFNVTFDWFKRDTRNMIMGMEGVSYNIGSTAPLGNYGSLSTRGWELELNWGKIFNNGFSINITGTIADARSIVTEYGTNLKIDNWYKGKVYGEIWGYQVDRLYQYDDFQHDANGNLVPGKDKNGNYSINLLSDPNAPTQGYISAGTLGSGFGPGDVKYKDLNGDGVIDAGNRILYKVDANGNPILDEKGNKIADYGDLCVIGNTTPRYEYSARVDLGFKNFDLSIFFQGIGKRDMWGSSSLTLAGFNTSDGSMAQTFAGDFWYETKDATGKVIDSNYGAFYPRAANGSNGNSLNMQPSDRYLINMAYLRLKNVTLGYTIPEKLTRKIMIDKFRVYVSLENYLTFDHLKGLPIDVEEIAGYSSFNTDNYNSSRAGLGTPAFKSASVGLQLTF